MKEKCQASIWVWGLAHPGRRKELPRLAAQSSREGAPEDPQGHRPRGRLVSASVDSLEDNHANHFAWSPGYSDSTSNLLNTAL